VYPHQAERLAAALARGGFDALVATSPANVAYITGFWSLACAVDPFTEIYAVVAPGGTVLVVSAMEALAVSEGDAQADHVVCYGRFHYTDPEQAGGSLRRLRATIGEPAADAADAVAAALAAVGVRAGRIGLDDASLPAGRRAALGERLADSTLVPSSEAFAQARLIKSPYEIECLQHVLHVTEQGIDTVLGLLGPGMTEQEAAMAFAHEVARLGATPGRTIVAFGAGAAVPAPWPTDCALRLGDLVRFDLGCVAKGYRSNVARMAVMGEPARRQQAIFDALHTDMQAALDALRPGVAGGQVFDTTLAAVREAGLSGYERHHVGHAIGLEPVEAPWLAPGGAALEMGMMLCVETPCYVVGDAGFTLTETALVTRSGADVLNRSHRGLILLD
jgi:Xaa-Pro aminopeptidase